MVSQDFLNYSLGIGFLVLTGSLSYSAFNFTVTLKKVNSILDRIDDITHDVEDLKNGIKVGLSYFKSMIVRKVGDKHGRK